MKMNSPVDDFNPLDDYAHRHMCDWLDENCPDPDTWSHQYSKLRTFVQDNPDLLERWTWRQMSDVIERNEKLGIK